MESRNYKDGFVSMSKMNVKQKLPRLWRCPICGEEIKKGDKVYLLINDNQYFPNCMIHQIGCYNEEKHINVFWEIEKKAIMYRESKDMF